MKKISSLAELRELARTSPGYQALAMRAAKNLGGQGIKDVDSAMRWLLTNAAETSEKGVVAEVNFCRGL